MADNIELFNVDAERCVLGSIILNPAIADDVFAVITSTDFYDKRNVIVAAAIMDMNDKGAAIDIVTVGEYLHKSKQIADIGGLPYLTELSIATPTSANYRSYLDIVSDFAKRRNVLEGLKEAARALKGGAADYLEMAQSTIEKANTIGTSEITPISDLVGTAYETFGQKRKTGIKTGFTKYDYLTGGYQKGDLNILAARPSIGKTAFAVNIMANMALRDKVVIYFSLETTGLMIAKRAIINLSKVNENEVADATPESADLLCRVLGELAESKLVVVDNAYSLPKMKSTIKRVMSERKAIDLVIIDYLNIMDIPSGKNSTKAQEVGNVTRNMKIMAKEIQIPILLLAQLNRESEKRRDTKPMLSDLKDSGAIEQDADTVTLLHRKSRDDEEALVIVAKNREGATGEVDMRYDGAHYSFYEYE